MRISAGNELLFPLHLLTTCFGITALWWGTEKLEQQKNVSESNQCNPLAKSVEGEWDHDAGRCTVDDEEDDDDETIFQKL